MSDRTPEHQTPGQARASHADRELVAELLREAAGDGRLTTDELDQRLEAAFAARTYGELEPLTSDLPPLDPSKGPVAGRRDAAPGRVGGQPGRRWSFALMSGTTRRGHWVLGRGHNAVALMGGVDLDLRDAELESPEVTIWAFALMGGVDIVVPDDCALDASGFGLMGGFDHADSAPPPPPGAPVVRVRALALMGGVTATRKPPESRRDASPGHRRELEP